MTHLLPFVITALVLQIAMVVTGHFNEGVRNLSGILGVAIPFLLSAWYLSKMDSILMLLASKARTISMISMALIIGFGLILVTDNFHVVSDMIYPYLGLG